MKWVLKYKNTPCDVRFKNTLKTEIGGSNTKTYKGV